MPPSPPASIHVAVCCGAAEATAAVVMLTSAKLNKAAESHYCVHVLQVEPCPGLDEQLQALRAADFDIVPAQLSPRNTPGNGVARLSAASLARLQLCELLPQQDKVLLLDCGAMVHGDLAALYHMPLGECLLAGFPEPAFLQEGLLPYRRDIVPAAPYLNGKILLMNLAAMRRQGWATQQREALPLLPSHWLLPEQDLFNSLAGGKVCLLPPQGHERLATRNHAEATSHAASKTTTCYLFGVFPLWSVCRQEGRSSFKLFGVLPLINISACPARRAKTNR